MRLGVALPWMLCWLATAVIPLVLARLAVRHPRLVRWGPSDLLAAAARASRVTRGGLPWLLVIVRGLLLASAAVAASRPWWQPPATLPGLRHADATAGAGRIAVVTAAAVGDSSLAIRRAVESLAGMEGSLGRAAPARRGLPPPQIMEVDIRDLSLVAAAPRTLILLCDQAPLSATDAQAVTAAVDAGAALLVCLGPLSTHAEDDRRRLSIWLDALAGITVGGRVLLPDSAIEVMEGLATAVAAPPEGTSVNAAAGQTASGSPRFAPLAGPAVSAAAELDGGLAATVLARTSPDGRPLLVETRRGRGTVCVSALPLSLHSAGRRGAEDDWSDLAAWPAFVPFVDALLTRLLDATTTPTAHDPAATSAAETRTATGRPAAVAPHRSSPLALAPAFIAAAIACLLAEWWLAAPAAADRPVASVTLPQASRAVVLAILVTMVPAWSGLPAGDARPADRPRPVAVLIDTSPSMAGRGPDDAGANASRLDAAIAALRDRTGQHGPLERIAADRPLAMYGVAATLEPLGTRPDGVSTGILRGLTTLAPAPAASRLGDAVVSLLAGAEGEADEAALPAAIVVASDGGITAGASWSTAARMAARRGVPLVALPVAGAVDTATAALPPGFRVTAVRAARLCRADEPVTIEIEAEATAADSSLEIRAAVAANGPTVARAALACDPTTDGMSARFSGRLTVPADALPGAGSRLVSPLISIGRTAAVASDQPVLATMTCPLAVTDAPLRVLLIEATPRFEHRFLERLLARDRAFDVQTCMLDRRAAGQSPSAPLPGSTTAWNRFDVVILGDVAAASEAGHAEAWRTLHEAATVDGIGIAWQPGGRSWAEPDPDLAWLPAVPGGVESVSVPRRLRATTGGRADGWLPAQRRPGPTGDVDFHPEVFAVLRPAALRPTARIIATAVPPDVATRQLPAPAVIVDRQGAATILAHLCETWRWRRDDEPAYAAYWRGAVHGLGERHLLGRLFAATIDVRPPAPEEGETVHLEITPPRPGATLDGWRLELASPQAAPAGRPISDPGAVDAVRGVARIDLPPAGLGGTSVVRIAGLPAGTHAVRLVPATDSLPTDARVPADGIGPVEIIVTSPPVETAAGLPAVAAFAAAARASGGDVVRLDAIGSLPEVVATAVARADRAAATPTADGGVRGRLGSIGMSSLLMLALAIAATVAWWQPRCDFTSYSDTTARHS